MTKQRNHFVQLASWLGLAVALFAAPSCSKTNNVDVSNGALPAGAECEPAADDPCAGTCVGGLCRPACGANRECPSNARCVGDGEAAACVPEDFGRLDLLRDCGDGCSLELAPFGREGHFFSCESEYGDVYSIGYDEAGEPLPVGFPEMLAFGKPDIEPATLCSRVSRKTHAVKGNLLLDIETDSCRFTPFGVVGDKLVRLEFKHLAYLDTGTPSARIGYLYDQGGSTYLLGAYGLYRFEAGAVDEEADDCSGNDDIPLTYPALGDVPTGFSGFWVECPEDMAAEDCAALELGQGPWDPATSFPDMLALRDDGYMVDYWWSHTCNGAFRSSAEDPDTTVVIRHYHENLWMETQRWSSFEAADETFLKVLINGVTDESYGKLYRLMPRPAEFQYDPCNDVAPEVGF